MNILAILNVAVFAAILIVFAYKLLVIWRYRKLEHVAAEIIVRSERANCVDLAVFLIFAANSVFRTVTGYDNTDWNSIAPGFAIALRASAIWFGFEATLFSDRQFVKAQQELQQLVNAASACLREDSGS